MSLSAISPIDGRYAAASAPLRDYLSEFALMKYRVAIEARWLIALSEHDGVSHIRGLTAAERDFLDSLASDFDEAAARRVKAIESEINHDLKAVETYLRERLEGGSLRDIAQSLHFACTSDDINNLAYALMFRDALRQVWQPQARALIADLDALAANSAELPMLARTHGQAATPTTLGKEMAVFAHRLRRQLRQIEGQEHRGKFNGAVGAFNAHRVAYPDVDWRGLSRDFVRGLGLAHNPLTTQIEDHDYLAELAHGLCRFNAVLLDACRDIWAYISLGYFRQRVVAAEVGSSTMPHKVNPIDFENAEANLGLSNAILAHLAGKLPVSRFQRDLSDSSALRNYGVGIAHSYLGLKSFARGLSKLDVDRAVLAADLDGRWEILAEAAQTILRKHHRSAAYESLKALTRGREVTREGWRAFVLSLDMPEGEKQNLLALQPATYLGCAAELARDGGDED